MGILTDAQRAKTAEDVLWIGKTPEGDALVDRIEVALAALPPKVGQFVAACLEHDPDLSRSILASLALARSAGYTVDGLGEIGLRLVHPDKGPMALFVQTDAADPHPCGRPQDVERLTSVLDATFQGRQYALYLRRKVPVDVDPAPVSRAVHLWLAAIDRGEWKGRHAIYEEQDVALELTLVAQRPEGRPGRVMTVGPMDALERLVRLDNQIGDVAALHRRSEPGVPMVVALVSQTRWRLPRGYVEQCLYGTAIRTEAANGPSGPTYRAQFGGGERALLADAACATVSAIWWLERASADPMAFRAWANDNPWCLLDHGAPDVPVTRFLAATGTDDRKVLSWFRRDEQLWSGA